MRDTREAEVGLCTPSEAVSRHGVTRRGRWLLILLCTLTAAAAALSFLLADTGVASEGELYRAVAFVEGFAEDNRAIAVFLGLQTEDDATAVDGKENEIAKRAEDYIREHGG